MRHQVGRLLAKVVSDVVSRFITLCIHLVPRTLPRNALDIVLHQHAAVRDSSAQSILARCICQVADVLYLLSFSGGVMIYFDRIEVVNYLVPSAGKLTSVQQAKIIKQCTYPQPFVHFFSHLELTWH